MARKQVLKQFVRIAALLGGGMRQFRREFGGEMHFHRLQLLLSSYAKESPNRSRRFSDRSLEHRRRRAAALLGPSARPLGQQEIAVHAGDDFQFDFLGAHGFAFADVGAASETQ